jgi:hypothetical protein
MSNLHHMIFGHAVGSGGLADRDKAIIIYAELNQQPQGVVGMHGEAHLRFPT